MFLPNVPGAMSIPESRVKETLLNWGPVIFVHQKFAHFF